MARTNTLFAVLVTVFFALEIQTVYAQFPVTLRVDARSGSVVRTPTTRTDARYRITVEGTYSQWPQFADCRGVDAVWVYDVPQEEIDAFRWPPREVLGRPFLQIPHWVGDSTVYAFPPPNISPQALFEISFRRLLGFRVNGEPLGASPLDRTLHRYQHERAGTGESFSFQILDSTFNVLQGRVIPRYEDNCGELVVTVEEILERDINICDVKPVVVAGQTVGIRVDAAVFQRDSTLVDGRRNLLLNQDQIGIVDNGRFICPDSLVCDSGRRTPLSIGLVIDVSGSMGEPILYNGEQITRLEAVKRSLRNFIRKLQPGDSLFLLTFSNSPVLVQDWTTDTARLGQTIDRLRTDEATALHAAMVVGLQKTATNPREGRVLIVLTDGLNNRVPLSESPVVEVVRKSNVPVYFVALGYSDSVEDLEGLEALKRFLAAAPRGRIYEALTGNELDAAYQDMATSLATENCCRLYFKLRPCDRGQRKRTISLVYFEEGQIINKSIVVDCELRITSVAPDSFGESGRTGLVVRPTPSRDIAKVRLTLSGPAKVTATVYSADGFQVAHVDAGVRDAGLHELSFDTQNWEPGLYLCRIWNGQSFSTAKILVKGE